MCVKWPLLHTSDAKESGTQLDNNALFNKWYMSPKSNNMNIVGGHMHISRQVTFTLMIWFSMVHMIELAVYIHIYYFLNGKNK